MFKNQMIKNITIVFLLVLFSVVLLHEYQYFLSGIPEKIVTLRHSEKVFIGIITAHFNNGRRTLIRKTLLKRSLPAGVQVKFIIGHTTNKLITYEIEKYNDMIMLDVDDNYKSLPYKLIAMYDYVITKSKYEWIVKVDDDCYFNANTILDKIPIFKNESVLIGNIMVNSKPHRTGKWKEYSSFKRSVYPPFPLGSLGHVVSRHLAEQIVLDRNNSVILQGEDVSLGMWAEKHSAMIVSLPTVFNQVAQCVKGSWVCGHEVKSLRKMQELMQY